MCIDLKFLDSIFYFISKVFKVKNPAVGSYYALVILLLTSLFSYSQQYSGIPIGTWRAHPSTNSLTTITAAEDKIYAGSNEALIQYNLTDNSSSILSKSEGFSENSVSKINYYREKNITIIAYENGNIDLIKGNEIVNINDLKRKQLTGSKRINDIAFDKDFAILSTDFGIVLIDLIKEEIKEAAMNIGPEGRSIKIIASAINNDSIFSISQNGIMVASMKSNLLNYLSWTRFSKSDSIPSTNLTDIVSFNGSVYSSVTTKLSNNQVLNLDSAGLYKYNQGKWTKVLKIEAPIYSLNSSNSKVIISCYGSVSLYNGTSTETIPVSGSPYESVYDKNGYLWIADQEAGLKSNKNGDINTTYQPNAPYYRLSFKMRYGQGRLFNFHGGYKTNTENMYLTKGFSVFEEMGWKYFSSERNTFAPSIDLIDGAYNPISDLFYVSSYGSGIYEMKGDRVITHYTDINSPLYNIFPGSLFIRVSAIGVDSSGTLWAVNNIGQNTIPFIHSKSLDGIWKSYKVPMGSTGISGIEMVIDDQNNKWIRVKPVSNVTLILFNEDVNGKQLVKTFGEGVGKGGLPASSVTAIALDHNGEMWAGTTKGIAILKNTANAHDTEFTIPYFDGFPILMDKEVTAIEIDGGNRKWVGTRQGLWLFNDDATEVIHYFDEENSPLPSNEIRDIEIDKKSGEVFISTSNGLVSYRGDATESSENSFSNVKVFPNPVKSNYSGLIGISGLARDANVKITDIFGNLIFETKAEGGTAVWNGNNYNGERAKTGVYLIFSTTGDGKEGNVAKVAVVE